MRNCTERGRYFINKNRASWGQRSMTSNNASHSTVVRLGCDSNTWYAIRRLVTGTRRVKGWAGNFIGKRDSTQSGWIFGEFVLVKIPLINRLSNRFDVFITALDSESSFCKFVRIKLVLNRGRKWPPISAETQNTVELVNKLNAVKLQFIISAQN